MDKSEDLDSKHNALGYASDWSLYNVLVIEWRENVVYKLAVGWIYK